MKELYIDEPAEWTTRELRQIHTADPVGMGRKSSQCTIFKYVGIVYRHNFLPIPNGSAVCIWRNSLDVHFAGSSIFNSFIYGTY